MTAAEQTEKLWVFYREFCKAFPYGVEELSMRLARVSPAGAFTQDLECSFITTGKLVNGCAKCEATKAQLELQAQWKKV
jgi:GTP1/Obg family GTP-binding protein